jgi:hypothetical protein
VRFDDETPLGQRTVESRPVAPSEVRLDSAGKLDEVVSSGAVMENLDDNHWFIEIGDVAVWLHAKGRINATYERRPQPALGSLSSPQTGAQPELRHQSCNHVFAPSAFSESGEPVTGRICTLCGAPEALRHQVGRDVEALIAPARELLVLYDWRPELAEREKSDISLFGKLQSDTKALLREYGERKKAGWIALRAALADYEFVACTKQEGARG